MKVEEKITNIDIKTIIEELKTLPSFNTQICLQGVEGNDDPFLGCGTEGGKNSWERKQNHNYSTKDFKYPIFSSMPYTNGVIKGCRMTHTRVMLLKPKTCYSYHQDKTKRVHIPLKTNEDCFLIIDHEIFHLPSKGNYFIVNTMLPHTALNCSQEDRIHIIGNIGNARTPIL